MTTPRPLGPDSKVTMGANVYARPFGDEIVLLEFGKGDYFALDEVGAEIWRGIETGATIREIAERLTERFDVAVDQALADTVALVGELEGADLIVIT